MADIVRVAKSATPLLDFLENQKRVSVLLWHIEVICTYKTAASCYSRCFHKYFCFKEVHVQMFKEHLLNK